MNAHEVVRAIRAAHPKSALVPEVVISVPDWRDDPARMVPERRIDALMFASLQRTAIEVKISRADMRREHGYKTIPWQRVTHRFVYAVPAGLIQPDEVFEMTGVYAAGLWWVHDDGRVEVVLRAKINAHPEPLPQHVVQALAYRASKSAESGAQ